MHLKSCENDICSVSRITWPVVRLLLVGAIGLVYARGGVDRAKAYPLSSNLGSSAVLSASSPSRLPPAKTIEEAFDRFRRGGGWFRTSYEGLFTVLTKETRHGLVEQWQLEDRCTALENELNELMWMLFGEDRECILSSLPPQGSTERRPSRRDQLEIRSQKSLGPGEVELTIGQSIWNSSGTSHEQRFLVKAIWEDGGWRLSPPPILGGSNPYFRDQLRRYADAIEHIIAEVRAGQYASLGETREALIRTLVRDSVEPGSPEYALELFVAALWTRNRPALLALFAPKTRALALRAIEFRRHTYQVLRKEAEAVQYRFGRVGRSRFHPRIELSSQYPSSRRCPVRTVAKDVVSDSHVVFTVSWLPLEGEVTGSFSPRRRVSVVKIGGEWKVELDDPDAVFVFGLRINETTKVRTVEVAEEFTRRLKAGRYRTWEEALRDAILIHSLAGQAVSKREDGSK